MAPHLLTDASGYRFICSTLMLEVCMESRYYSIACQRQHWNDGHKHKCVKAEEPSAATAAATAAAVAAE